MTPLPNEDVGQTRVASASLAELQKQTEMLQRQVKSLTRRRDILLDERAVFERLLADRERQIGVLRREIGRSRKPLQDWIDQCRLRIEALLGRMLIVGRGWSAQTAPATPAVPPTSVADLPVVPFALDGRSPRVIGIAVFGLSAEALEKVVEDVQAALRGKLDLVPLFLVGSPNFELFRRQHLLFEYLPSPERQRPFLPDLDWDTYLLRRLALLRRSWQPARILAFGPTARAVLEQWLDSPFEDETITSVIYPISDLEKLP